MSYQSIKRRTLNAYYKVKETNLKKVTYCMITIILHFGKGETMETIKKISACSGLEGGRDEHIQHKELLGQ